MSRPHNQLPDKLVDLLREMRAKGVSIRGLRQATGLAADTIIRYTSPEVWQQRTKWSDAALQHLRDEYPDGKSLEDFAIEINAMLNRSDITPHAVQVKVGQMGLHRKNRKPRGSGRIDTDKSVDNAE